MHQQTGLLRCAIASLGFIAAVACQPTSASAQDLPPLPKAIKDAGMIRIGVKCDSPPFGSSGPTGKPIGIEVEMAKQIGTFAFGSPEKAELSCVATDARIPSLTGGKIDLILATLGKTPPREQVIDYSDIYYLGKQQRHRPEGQPCPETCRPEGKSILIVKGGSRSSGCATTSLAFSSCSSTRADNVQALQQGRATVTSPTPSLSRRC